MSYRIAQDFEYAGNDYWRWSAWIEAADTALDKVREVTWILHPTFKQSRVRVTDRSSKFRLKTAGWGTFLLRAEVVLQDGAKQLLKHNLRLEYEKTSVNDASASIRAPAKSARPLIVFLSYSAQDSRTAARYREGLKKAGLEVMDQTTLGAGERWGEALKRMISQADAVVGLVGDDEIGPWVSAELEAAVAADKPAFALLSTQASTVGIPKAVRTVEVDVSHFDPSQIAELLRSHSQE
jgi:hypothetical protein